MTRVKKIIIVMLACFLLQGLYAEDGVMTGTQLEAAAITYNDISKKKYVVENYCIDVCEKDGIFIVEYFLNPEKFPGQRGSIKESPGITYEVDMTEKKIIKIVYSK